VSELRGSRKRLLHFWPFADASAIIPSGAPVNRAEKLERQRAHGEEQWRSSHGFWSRSAYVRRS
jgi:hypothetical protein